MNYILSAIIILVSIGGNEALPFSSKTRYDCQAIRQKALLKNLDFQRYLGHWYELYHTKDFYFDRGCSCITADYTLQQGQTTIRVDNKCQKNNATVEKVGKATIVGNASLEVSFGLPFKAPYDIIYISDDYSYAGVLSCTNIPVLGGLELWILGRNPTGALNIEAIDDVLRRFHEVGLGVYINDMIQTNQTHCNNNLDETHLFEDDPHYYKTNLTGFNLGRYFGQYNIIAEIPDIVEHLITANCDCMKTAVYKNMTTEQQCLRHNNMTEHLLGHLVPISSEFSSYGRFIQKESFITEHYQILDITDDYRNALVVNSISFGTNYDITECLYLLSRDSSMPKEVFKRFIHLAKDLDIFHIEHLRYLDTNC